ncbi:hypothetical protein ACJMK2_021260, partial [Sinanodonta woodiana]
MVTRLSVNMAPKFQNELLKMLGRSIFTQLCLILCISSAPITAEINQCDAINMCVLFDSEFKGPEEVIDTQWKIFCFTGREHSLLFLWTNPV